MNFRKAKFEDIDTILKIIKDAKEHLKNSGLSQWQGDYPDRSTIEEDIEKEIGYVLSIDDIIKGYVVVDFIDDEIYRDIKGKWKTDGLYASIHRTAIDSSCRGLGYGSEFFKFAEKVALERGVFSVRVDTDPKNLTMKHLFEKNGYEYCGTVFIEGEKIAYEKILKGE